MHLKSRGKAPLFPILILAFAAPTSSFAAACDNARLQKMMNDELHVEQAEAQCRRSSRAGADYGKIWIPNHDRSGQLEVTCCAAARILVHEEVRSIVQKDLETCDKAQRPPEAAACNGAVHCLRQVRDHYKNLNAAKVRLADYLRDINKAAEPCGDKFEKVKQAARQQMARARAEFNRIPAAQRAEFLKATSVRVR